MQNTPEQSLTVRPYATPFLAVALVLGIFFLAGKEIERRGADANPATISISADAKVMATPNIALVSFGVQVDRTKTAKEALDQLTEKMNAVLTSIEKQNVEKKDITTQSVSLNPVYDWNNGTQTLRGYQANQQLSIKVRDLDKVGDILSSATAAGANTIGGVSFQIDEPEGLYAQARAKAIEKAKAKAEVLAKDLGVRLMKLKGYSDGAMNFTAPRAMMYEKSMMMDGVGGGSPELSVPSGEQEITANVTLTYEVE